MITFKQYILEKTKMKGEDPCWKDYEMVGTKRKNGKEVPNCVPKNEQVEHIQESVEDITQQFIQQYNHDPAGAFMHAKSSYLDAVGSAKNFSKKAAELHKSHASMSKQEFQDTVMKHFGKHLKNHGFPKHASKGWGEAEHDLVKEMSK